MSLNHWRQQGVLQRQASYLEAAARSRSRSGSAVVGAVPGGQSQSWKKKRSHVDDKKLEQLLRKMEKEMEPQQTVRDKVD